MADKFQVILNTCPDKASAEKIAVSLVKSKLCACVNIVPGIESVYYWQGKIEKSQELLLVIKTTENAYPQIEKHILDIHPNELPEIIAVSIDNGLPDYLSWINDNTNIEKVRMK